MSLKFLSKLFIFTLIASVLTGCGFHLRSSYSVPEELSTLSLTSFDQYGKLTRDVEHHLMLNKVDLVAPADLIPNLHIIDEGVTERTLSLYQNSRAAEKELTYTVAYRVTLPNVGSRTFSTKVNRNFLDNPLTALAKSVERDVIENEMRAQAASQIIRQLAQVRNQLEKSGALAESQ